MDLFRAVGGRQDLCVVDFLAKCKFRCFHRRSILFGRDEFRLLHFFEPPLLGSEDGTFRGRVRCDGHTGSGRGKFHENDLCNLLVELGEIFRCSVPPNILVALALGSFSSGSCMEDGTFRCGQRIFSCVEDGTFRCGQRVVENRIRNSISKFGVCVELVDSLVVENRVALVVLTFHPINPIQASVFKGDLFFLFLLLLLHRLLLNHFHHFLLHRFRPNYHFRPFFLVDVHRRPVPQQRSTALPRHHDAPLLHDDEGRFPQTLPFLLRPPFLVHYFSPSREPQKTALLQTETPRFATTICAREAAAPLRRRPGFLRQRHQTLIVPEIDRHTPPNGLAVLRDRGLHQRAVGAKIQTRVPQRRPVLRDGCFHDFSLVSHFFGRKSQEVSVDAEQGQQILGGVKKIPELVD